MTKPTTDLTMEEQKLLFTYARKNHYPHREIRDFPPDSVLGKYFNNMLISCDVDNSVLIFKHKNQAQIDDDFGSMTAISYNPHCEKEDETDDFVFNPDPPDMHHKKAGDNSDTLERQLTKDTIPFHGLENTRRNLITSVLRNPNIPSLQGKTLNRLIQCDLCVQPSANSATMPIDNHNVSNWQTLKEAMDKSQIVVLGWGNGPYKQPGDLMNALAACKKQLFDVDAFYTYLKARVAKQEVYTLGLNQKNQPYQPAAQVKLIVQPLTNEKLDLLFS